MIITISPAKTLDLNPQDKTDQFTRPAMLKHATELVVGLRGYSAEQLGKLMSVNDKIARENFDRFQAWKTPFRPANAKQAVLAFKGDVYRGLAAEEFSAEDFDFAQDHLRILSGLYGVLRPLDLMQAYRLEMGTAFVNDRGANLYEFWGDLVTKELNKTLKKHPPAQRVLINLASQEYFTAVRPDSLSGRIITPQFKEKKDGKYRVLGLYAKRARGLMTRFIIQNRITEPDAIRGFDVEGYRFEPSKSTDTEWFFSRPQPKPKAG